MFYIVSTGAACRSKTNYYVKVSNPLKKQFSHSSLSLIKQLYGAEWDMWSDMNVAIEDLSTVNFILVRQAGNNKSNASMPIPKITGSRQSLVVFLPVPDYVYAMLPPSNGQSPLNRDQISFKVTPVIN